MKITIEFYIAKLIHILNFSFNKQFWFLEQISRRKIYFQSKTHKKWTLWILHIQISLSTNFHLKLTIAIFWTKFGKKGSYFQSKTDKTDITIEFCIFELVFVSNFTLNMFLNILKISKISLFWTFWKKKFDEKFWKKIGCLLPPGLFLSWNCIKLFKQHCANSHN